MEPRRVVLLLLMVVWTTVSLMGRERPNVVLILADDLGYSDLGCYGGEIQTPNLDRLAENGLRFPQFYNTARCWPTRAALLTGYYAQQVRRDRIPGYSGRSGGGGLRPSWALLLPEYLKTSGYRSYHSGKWHLDGMPLRGGFDRSYYLKDQGRFFNPKTHFLNDAPLPAVVPDEGFYGTTEIASRAIEQLAAHAQDHSKTPFFMYLAFTAPHFPLHALPEDIAVYDGRYDQGWESIRQQRWDRQRALGIPFGAAGPGGASDRGAYREVVERPSPVETKVGPPYAFPEHLEKLGDGEVNRPIPWEALDRQQQAFQAAKMEAHAAMVHRMDIEIGRVFDQLRSTGSWENTLILFLSDNGASAEIMVRDDGHDPEAPAGSAATYLCLGPGWSTVSNTPFRRHKTWTHEGGIRTPCIMHWPAGLAETGHWFERPHHVIDLAPTIFQVAGVSVGGRDAPEFPGESIAAALENAQYREPRALWWLHEGNRAFRQGVWKAVAEEGSEWELYHLASDPFETRDLARREPKRLEALRIDWARMNADFLDLANRSESQNLRDPRP